VVEPLTTRSPAGPTSIATKGDTIEGTVNLDTALGVLRRVLDLGERT
jgi:hypothetical protein